MSCKFLFNYFFKGLRSQTPDQPQPQRNLCELTLSHFAFSHSESRHLFCMWLGHTNSFFFFFFFFFHCVNSIFFFHLVIPGFKRMMLLTDPKQQVIHMENLISHPDLAWEVDINLQIDHQDKVLEVLLNNPKLRLNQGQRND